MVASSSAFISTTSLPCLKASSTTWAPYSTEPVTSTSTSMCGERARSIGSSVATGRARAAASSNLSCDSATTMSSQPAYLKTATALSGRRLEIATTRMPGVLLTIWLVRPWHMKPAPTMPTRMGRSCSARAFSAVSTIHMALLLRAQLTREPGRLSAAIVMQPPLRATSCASLRPRSHATGGTPDPSAEITETGSGHLSPSRGSS